MKSAHTAQRIAAYIIDIIIVSIIVSLLTIGIPRSNKYEKANEENKTILNDYYDNKIDDEEAVEKFYENRYIMEKEVVPESLIVVVITIGYYVIFAFYNKGQTIGKKLLHIRIVSNEGEDVSYIQLFFRSLIINDCFYSIASILLIIIIKSKQFLYTIGLLGLIHAIVFISSIFMAIYRKDKRGLHDMISKTRVIEE